MVLGPLIFWLIKKGESQVAAHEAKKCLNFQITVFIALLVLVLMAALKANKGEEPSYPFSLNLIK